MSVPCTRASLPSIRERIIKETQVWKMKTSWENPAQKCRR